MKLNGTELDEACRSVTQAAITEARNQGAHLLLNWLGVTHISAEEAVTAFLRRDPDDPHYRQLSVHAQQWALAVARIAERATRPGPNAPDALAVADARERGASWSAIADAFDISTQSAHSRYKAGAPRGGRRGPSPKTEDS